MPSLREVQAAVGQALLGADAAAAGRMIRGDGFDPLARLAIHRHQFFGSLTAALKTTYPVLCALVHERFFDRLAHAFIRAHPPAQPCLSEYGAGLAPFVAQFPACGELPWLRDVAALEWCINRVRTAPLAAAVSPAVVASAAACPGAAIRLTLAPRVGVLHSPWPVHRIWAAHQPGADGAAAIALDCGEAHLEISCDAQALTIRPIEAPCFACLEALIGGSTLQSAAQAALALDPLFDLVPLLRGLVNRNLITDVRVSPSKGGCS